MYLSLSAHVRILMGDIASSIIIKYILSLKFYYLFFLHKFIKLSSYQLIKINTQLTHMLPQPKATIKSTVFSFTANSLIITMHIF
jgi:hypothetical protein